jgi:uncharacterized caspase-like protein
VSSDELSGWMRDVDAGDLVMIVDTCHSAATVEEPGFKPGPMGSRGLGQLAYDKGMRILAASQADDVALESEKLKQGLLTYALVQNGLEDRQAAGSDGKGEITMEGWLTVWSGPGAHAVSGNPEGEGPDVHGTEEGNEHR